MLAKVHIGNVGSIMTSQRKVSRCIRGCGFWWKGWPVAFFLVFCVQNFALGQQARLKDLVNIRGSRTNTLIGFGLVIGLNKTGDSPKSVTTNKAIASALAGLGIATGDSPMITQSLAAVIVTAELPAFAKNGDKIDVKLSIIGDAISRGGTLLPTPLKAGNGEIFALAEGAVVLGQANGVGTKVQTVARIPGGGQIERDFVPDLIKDNVIDLSLRVADFTTAFRVAQGINERFREKIAKALDPSHIQVVVPRLYLGKETMFIAEMENVAIEADQRAVVIVNERTGTVVMGGDVKISRVVVSHNGLAIEVGTKEKPKQDSLVPLQGTTVGELVKSLNNLGVKADDLISILQSIHAAGALQAELRLL